MNRIFFLVLVLALTACQRTQPVDFKANKYSCDSCRMNIVDMRFKVEILSPKGKVHRFDSIECMQAWEKENPKEVQSRWVTDFYHPEKWIPFEKAYLLKSKSLASPMGASLSAYETPEELEQAKKEFGETATFNVCKDCSLHSIQEAIAHAKNGETVVVGAGIYPEGTIVIDKPIHLKGIDSPVIDGLKKGHVFYIHADDVTIEGFTIRNSGASYVTEFAGIRAEEIKNCKILNNVFENNTYSIYLAKADSCLIEGNVATGNTKEEVSGGNGVHLWYSKNITVKNNLLKNHRDGIYLEFTPDSLIEGNVSTQNIRYGLHFMFSSRDKFYKNVFTKNQTGVAVMYSKNIEIKENRFEKSWGRAAYGLLLKDITDSVIEKNDFTANTVGLFADGSNRNRCERNNFKNNGWGVNILGSSDDNRFTQNNFIGNYFNVVTNTQNPLNVFNSNYWSNYEGYDLNHDGLGDVAFHPMELFSLWINRYPELVVLLASPAIQFLEVAERVFPVLTPKTLLDQTPSMKPFTLLP